jgi:aspartate 1-decarboxylase
MNGAAARHTEVGDQVIVLTYESFVQLPPVGYKPTVVQVNAKNKITKIK